MAKLLWIDDEIVLLQSQVTQLRLQSFDVRAVDSVSKGINALKNEKFDAILLDIMMPPDDQFSDLETMGGMRTGIFLAQYIRLHFPSVPIFIYSISEPSLYDEKFLFFNGIKFFKKQEYPGAAIVDLVRNLPAFEVRPNALDIVELKPGMFGLKIDIKKFIEYMKKRQK